MDIRDQELNQLKKGVLKLVVLKVISAHKTYGYELITRIDEESNGLFKMKEGTLYPILYRLEDEKLIKSKWQNPARKQKAKKYYEITELGLERLELLGDLWLEVVVAVDNFITGGGVE